MRLFENLFLINFPAVVCLSINLTDWAGAIAILGAVAKALVFGTTIIANYYNIKKNRKK